MRRKHIITLLIACFATLSTWAGDVLTFRPITDVSQLKSGARTLIGAEWYGKYYVLYNDIEPSYYTGNPGHEVTLNSEGNLEFTREQLHMSHERNYEKPILLRMSCRTEGTHGYFDLSIFDDFYYYWVPCKYGSPAASKSIVFRQAGYYFDSTWEASFHPENDFIFWNNSEDYAVDNSHIFLANAYEGLTSGHYLSYLTFRGPDAGNPTGSHVGFTTDSDMDYDLLEYFSDGSKKMDTHIVLFQEVECQHDAVDVFPYAGLAPTCTTPGRTGVKYCKGCDKHYNADFTETTPGQGYYINPLGHNADGDHCSRCGETLGKYGFNLNNVNTWPSNTLYNCSGEWTLVAKGEDGKVYVPGYKVSANGRGLEAVELTQRSAANDAFYTGYEKDFPWITFTQQQYSSYNFELENGKGRLECYSIGLIEHEGYNYADLILRWGASDPILFPNTPGWQGISYTSDGKWRGNRADGKVNVYYESSTNYDISLLKDEEGNYYFGLVPQFPYGVDSRPDWQKTTHLRADCPHDNLQRIEAVAPTCTKGGNAEYYICEDCKFEFADNELNGAFYEDIHLEPIGHNYVDGFCTNCHRPAQNYRLVTDPKQIAAGRKYILVAKVDEGKSEQYYVMGEIGGKTPYGRGAAVPVWPDANGIIPGGNSEFSEIDIVEVPRGSIYNVKQEPLYYFVINGHSIRSYKGFDLGGMPIDPERDLIEQFKELGYINGLQEFEGDNNYIQSGAVLTYINGMDWKGPQSFANIKSLEPYSAVIYPKGVFEDPEHCFGFVNDGKETFFCSWYDSNPNTALPNVPIYLYVSTDDVVSYNKDMGTLYVEQDEPVTVEVIVDAAIKAQEKTSAPLTSIDLSATMLAYYFDVNVLKDAIFSSKDLDVSENALIILPDSYAPGKGDKKAKGDKGDEMTNVIVAGHSSRIELVDAQNLAVATDFSTDEFEYTKTLTTGRWSTLVLPAAVDVPAGIEAMELTSVDLDNLTITFTPVSTLTPNVPVIVRKTTEGDEPTAFSAFGVDVKATTGQVADIQFQGTYTGLGAGEAAALGYHILAPDNAFHPAGEKATIAPFRAFLTVSDSDRKGDGKDDGIKKSNLRIVFDTPTGLFTLGQQKLLQIALLPGAVTLRGEAGREVTIVDAAGRLVKRLRLAAEETTVSLPAGVYVVNGTKVSVK